jgi:hypothetical protein
VLDRVQADQLGVQVGENLADATGLTLLGQGDQVLRLQYLGALAGIAGLVCARAIPVPKVASALRRQPAPGGDGPG